MNNENRLDSQDRVPEQLGQASRAQQPGTPATNTDGAYDIPFGDQQQTLKIKQKINI